MRRKGRRTGSAEHDLPVDLRHARLNVDDLDCGRGALELQRDRPVQHLDHGSRSERSQRRFGARLSRTVAQVEAVALALLQHDGGGIEHHTGHRWLASDQVAQGNPYANPVCREYIAGTEIGKPHVQPGGHKWPVDGRSIPACLNRQVGVVQLAGEIGGQEGHGHRPEGQPPDPCSRQANHYNSDH